MIDQSNRAGKLKLNDGENLNGQNSLQVPTSKYVPITNVTNRRNLSKQTRGIPPNQKNLYRRTNSAKIPVKSDPESASAAADVSRRSPLSYMTKGKSV